MALRVCGVAASNGCSSCRACMRGQQVWRSAPAPITVVAPRPPSTRGPPCTHRLRPAARYKLAQLVQFLPLPVIGGCAA